MTATDRPGRALWVSTSTATRGGIASYVRMLSGTELWSRWRVRHVATHRDGRTATKVAIFALAVPRFLAELLLRRPDVVHVHMSSYGSFVRKAALCAIARVARVPVLVHVHGSEFDRFHDGLPPVGQALVRATLENAFAVVALGRQWSERLAAIAPAARVMTVPNGVRVPPPRMRGAVGPVRVVFLGEIGERKGAFTLLEAWAKLAAEPDVLGGARLTLAGDRGVEQAIEAVTERGIGDSVTVRSWLSPTQVDRLLGEADVFVLPSRSEGQPMAVLEAMAHGLAVIAGAVGGIPEMLDDGRCGLLVDPNDVDGLVLALRQVLAEPATRARLGAAARQRVLAEFDIDVVWRRFDSLYQEAVAR
jgi:glycosyltransferase involved in cell wall biosynthesis